MPISVGNRIAIVGSGPAAIACAKALLERGVTKPVLFDGGHQLDSGRQALVQCLGNLPPSQWPAASIAAMTRNPTDSGKGLPKKLVFGSPYIYLDKHPSFPQIGNVSATSTLAQGGFSMAWGGAMLPGHEEDLAHWPLKRADFEAAYRRVLSRMPFSGTLDELSTDFPLFCEPQGKLSIPKQAELLLSDLRKAKPGPNHADRLNFGQARLAVRTATDSSGSACCYCGYCLTGCPYRSIHTFDVDLRELVLRGDVEYRPGTIIHHFVEKGNAVHLWAVDGQNQVSPIDETFERVFIAAGALNSTRLALESLGLFGKAVYFQDSQKFAVPLLRFKRSPLEWPNINSLASLFIEANFPSVAPHWIHMQVSTVNEMVLKRLKVTAGQGLRWYLLAPFIERLMIAWCSLHSAVSDGFAASLTKGANGAPSTLHLVRMPSAAASEVTGKFLRKIARMGIGFKTLFLPTVMKSPLAGTSHFGSSFPMRSIPKNFNDSDMLGRPNGLSRIHLVDASVLPAIPATTIVLQTMANADRIATDVEFP